MYVDHSNPTEVTQTKNYLRSMTLEELEHVLHESCEIVLSGEVVYPSSVRRMIATQILIRDEIMARRSEK